MMCFLEVLRCILCCGDDEEVDRYSYGRLPAGPNRSVVYPGDRFNSPSYASRSVDPVRNWPVKPLILEKSGERSVSSSVNARSVAQPSKDSPSLNQSVRASLSSPLLSKASSPSSKALPTPLPSSRASLSSPLPSKASPSPILPSKPSSTPLPSSRPTPSTVLSNVSPYVLSSSKASPTLPSSKASPTLTSSKASPILPSSKASSTLTSSKASPALPASTLPSSKSSTSPVVSNVSPYALSSPKASPSLPPSSKPSESGKTLPELLEIKHQAVLPRYEIPKDLQDLFEMNMVPAVLKRSLSPSTYAERFATLLYADDFYLEKWSKFLLDGVTLKLHSRAPFEKLRETKKTKKTVPIRKKDFVAFEIDSIPERRPYLLSRDFVFARPLDVTTKPFKGILFRVVKSTTVLVEFGDDFHSQHSPTKRYDVSFSFNRVCLKRFHQAVSKELKDPLNNIFFPEPVCTSSSLNSSPNMNHPYGNLNQGRASVVSRILNHKGPIPYFIDGPLSVISEELSSTGTVIQEAILKIYRNAAHCRILICAPRNRTCDALIRSLHQEIPRSRLFRANAAFRDYELVPGDIIPECSYKEENECFTCPPLSKLQNFQVITSTFVSSFRLHAAGITADHFTHIFLVVDASVMEPEAAIALANLVGNNTVVVVTGSLGDSPDRMRIIHSDVAWRHGLKRSYFQRLLEREPYLSRHPLFISHLKE